ncbi:beta-N-acetylhexosaminidase [Actinomyces faecalis]|uniref:beta-N-acetylhexosaminidase n=1 Tax=Actinomyces faecalis TaxID=2722820 RepID=UPI001C131BD1|nr:beta-N-acetylhexosaminidase [Actinomyces faecalis]
MIDSPSLTTAPRPHLVPSPQVLSWLPGSVSLAGGVHVSGGELAPDAVAVLIERLTRSAGTGRTDAPEATELRLTHDPCVPEEGYRLLAQDGKITLAARTPAGFGWGVQTILQLLPARVLGPGPIDPASLVLPAVRIEDGPAHSWRGSHLDVARHFLPLQGLERHLEMMALHKLNVLHLHLTDDQGWRLPVEDYPLLTDVGAWRPGDVPGHQPAPDTNDCDDVAHHDGVRHGGFYTVAEIRHLVARARQLGITIMPEVDMPGHMEAAIAAYPELGCGHPRHPRTCWGISWHVLSLTRTTLDFCRTVLDTAMDLFPGSPIHVGGDECPGEEMLIDPRTRETMARIGASTRAQAQAWFEAEVCSHVLSAGRRVVAWDEVVEGEIDPAVTIMLWRDWGSFADTALTRGHDLIAAPASLTYFDYDQVTGPHRPVSIGQALPLERTAGLSTFLRRCAGTGTGHLLGGQFQLWTEYVRTWSRAENLLWPRGASIAQQLWSGSSAGATSYAELGCHLERLTACEVAWCREEEVLAAHPDQERARTTSGETATAAYAG